MLLVLAIAAIVLMVAVALLAEAHRLTHRTAFFLVILCGAVVMYTMIRYAAA